MSREESKRKIFKAGLIILVILLLVLAGIQIFLSFYLDSYVEKRLKTAVSEQTQGQYKLEINELDLRVWGREFQVDTLRLSPVDTASTAPRIEMDQLSISGIQFRPYLFGGNIHTGQVRFSKPVVTITQNSPDSLVFLQSSDSSSSSSNKQPPNIELGRLEIDDGSFTFLNHEQSDSLGELHDFNLEVLDIRLDSTTLAKPPFFNYSAIQSRSGKIRYEMSDLYALESNGIEISTSGRTLSVDSLKLIPQYPKYEFAEQVGHQLDRISLTIDRILLENADFEKLNAGELIAEKFTVENADLEVFHSKMMPPGPKSDKTFPHVAFKSLPFPVTIDTIAIHQADISYTEHLPDVSRPGTLSFLDTDAIFTNVTNDSTFISREHTIVLDVTSEVMGEATLDAHFEFPMHMDGSHLARGTLESMLAEKLNPVLEPVGLIRANSGTIHSLQFLMDLNDDRSNGWVLLVYSDLKIEVLNSKNVDDGGRKRLKSFLANILKIKNNNVEEPLRRGEVSFERDEQKSIFSYWWKSLSSGLKDSVGI